MAYELIKVLRAEGIAYVVAPYEADAQLAYLERAGLIDAIITEDSDLLVFGCRTVLFKLDTYGHCVELQQARFAGAKQISLAGWGADEFRRMAILSGCDYLPSIVGMGLKNAHRFLRRYESVDNVLRALRLEGKMHVPPSYADDFRRAEFTFVHQRVWDPRGSGGMTTLAPLPDDVDEALLAYIGAPIPWETARQIAAGDLCPIAHTPLGTACAAAPATAPARPPKGAQASLHAFFGARSTPRRVLGELDANRVEARTAHTVPTPAPAPPAAARTPPAPPAHASPPAAATPLPSRFFAPHAETSADASSLFDAHSSDGVHTPQTSPRADASPRGSASPRKDAWNEGVSSPVSSPAASPTHAAPAPAPPSPESPDENDADEARRAAWFKQFSFSAPRRADPQLRAARTPCRAVSDTTPTRPRGAAAPWTPRLPLARHEPRVPVLMKRTPPAPPAAAGAARTRSLPTKRAADALAPRAGADETPTKRLHLDTPAPGSGSAKLLQFRYKDP